MIERALQDYPHSEKIGFQDNGKRQTCEIDETVEHFIMQCPKHTQARETLIQKIRGLAPQPPTFLKETQGK